MRHGFCFHVAGVHSSFIGFVGREAQLRLHMEMVVLQDSKKSQVQQPKECSGDDNFDASQEHERATTRRVEGNKRKKSAMEMTVNVHASQAGKKDTGRS